MYNELPTYLSELPPKQFKAAILKFLHSEFFHCIDEYLNCKINGFFFTPWSLAVMKLTLYFIQFVTLVILRKVLHYLVL